jgi:hypothetical protein
MAGRVKSTNIWHPEPRNREKRFEAAVGRTGRRSFDSAVGRRDQADGTIQASTKGRRTVELWVLLLLLLLISVAWLKTWD